MKLAARIKSVFKGADVEELSELENCISVTFSQGVESVIVTEDKESNLFAASYPALVRDGKGGWTTSTRHSSNMLIDGLFWVLTQVEKNGEVRPEIVD